jgi:hypothetical protein
MNYCYFMRMTFGALQLESQWLRSGNIFRKVSFESQTFSGIFNRIRCFFATD